MRTHPLRKITSRKTLIHMLDTALTTAADTMSGYIQGLLDGIAFKANRLRAGS
ncbi:hypothetical protein ACVWW1_005452 [Bradyrhizobium sp. JR3.5]